MTNALKYAEALEAHLDEGGAFNEVNMRDLIRMVKDAEAVNADLVEALGNAPCFGCGVRHNDTSKNALSAARGCVTCRDRRALISRARSDKHDPGRAG